MKILECQNIGLIKNDQTILSNISFCVQGGDRIGVMGPSGSGKSSLFRLLNLLITPTQGRILYKDKNIQEYIPTQLRRSIGYILQKPYLFDGTVQDNLEYAYQVWGQTPTQPEILSYLERVNLPAPILKKTKSEMSGGEQQRVALVRSLLAKPKVLLLDEVTASLDEANTILLEEMIRSEWAAKSLTVFFISHQSEQLRRLASTILYVKKGKLEFCGPKDDFFKRQGGLNDE